MIIVRLMGGLGNQMFQYAAGRRLAHKNDTILKLDLSWFAEQMYVAAPRSYGLSSFPLPQQIASDQDVQMLHSAKKYPLTAIIHKWLPERMSKRAQVHVREKQFHFDPSILQLPDNVYLEGYWQSEKYFKDIEDRIRADFRFAGEMDEHNKLMADTMSGLNSVSVHFRRGDYVTHAATSRFHGTCSFEYYLHAMNLIAERIQNPRFFVFSDEPAWVKNNLNIKHDIIVVDQNGSDRALDDLRLMSTCRHHIVANSSFSWWGAWLCSNPDKIVIAPRKWFNDPKINTNDILPEKWVKL